jgi:hypothetical protein
MAKKPSGCFDIISQLSSRQLNQNYTDVKSKSESHRRDSSSARE